MTTVAEIGERSLIERMMLHITSIPDMPLPFWDDASAVSMGGEKAVVLKTDMLVWETDIPLGMSHYQAARKSVVMNFSDLGSKGVQPVAFLASMGVPRSTPVSAVEDMARGFSDGAREYGGYMLGGDTNETCDVIIAGMAYGIAEESLLMRRGGSNPGDVLCVTGPFGDTAAAFKILLEGFDAPSDLERALTSSVYLPEARVTEGVTLAETGLATSCMDSSDGLAISLYDLSRSSDNGFRITNVPISKTAEIFAEYNELDANKLALYGGEEYELVFTIKPGKVSAIRDALDVVGCQLIEIGVVTEEETMTYLDEGEEKRIMMGGWEHFKKNNSIT
ncbi:MAG: thiamine-phosphate kinase [Candidatus Bathyarchaeia archaeon]